MKHVGLVSYLNVNIKLVLLLLLLLLLLPCTSSVQAEQNRRNDRFKSAIRLTEKISLDLMPECY